MVDKGRAERRMIVKKQVREVKNLEARLAGWAVQRQRHLMECYLIGRGLYSLTTGKRAVPRDYAFYVEALTGLQRLAEESVVSSYLLGKLDVLGMDAEKKRLVRAMDTYKRFKDTQRLYASAAVMMRIEAGDNPS